VVLSTVYGSLLLLYGIAGRWQPAAAAPPCRWA